MRAARSKGLTVTKSSHTEDIHQHIDYWLAMSPEGKKHGVDVKGNNLPDEIWVEFKNVRGNPGWLYGGATIIAFDMPEEGGFSIVDRQELALFCEVPQVLLILIPDPSGCLSLHPTSKFCLPFRRLVASAHSTSP